MPRTVSLDADPYWASLHHHTAVIKTDLRLGRQQKFIKQLLDLVPSLCESYSESETSFNYNNPDIYQVNAHLEAGNRIEEFAEVHEVKQETAKYKKQASRILKRPRGKKLVGIYTSTLEHSWVRRGIAWDKNKWVELIQYLKGKGVEVALFGAEYDQDTRDFLVRQGVDFIDCTGNQHLGVSIEAMKKCDAFIGFPSGLPILAHYIGLLTIMFFPHERRHYKMLNTFCREEDIETGFWKGCTFPRLEQLTAWMESNEYWSKLLGND